MADALPGFQYGDPGCYPWPMDPHSHDEAHFLENQLVRDVVIGMADGLTVPFALAAGISGAAAGTHLVVTAGVAEIAAGSIAMALGGYLAARSEAEHFASELGREEREIVEKPEAEMAEVGDIFRTYGLQPEHYGPLIEGLRQRPIAWRDFMMRFELGLEKPDPRQAARSALAIGASYVVGGAVPLLPYLAFDAVGKALPWSATVTLLALAVFGWFKGRFTGTPALRSAVQTASIGGAAAIVAFLLARAVS
jgi:VIT1/CCC1 family predicted Fe2+/Mn2+ transporter